MALRENERRILAEIEDRLSTDDPELAGQLASFGGGELPEDEDVEGGVGGWTPWLVCGLIVAMMIGLFAVLFAVTPTGAEPVPAEPASSNQVVVPENEALGS